jgi:hypothetical protein
MRCPLGQGQVRTECVRLVLSGHAGAGASNPQAQLAELKLFVCFIVCLLTSPGGEK